MTVRYLRSIKSVPGLYSMSAIIEASKLKMEMFCQYQRINQASSILLAQSVQLNQLKKIENVESDTSERVPQQQQKLEQAVRAGYQAGIHGKKATRMKWVDCRMSYKTS